MMQNYKAGLTEPFFFPKNKKKYNIVHSFIPSRYTVSTIYLRFG